MGPRVVCIIVAQVRRTSRSVPGIRRIPRSNSLSSLSLIYRCLVYSYSVRVHRVYRRQWRARITRAQIQWRRRLTNTVTRAIKKLYTPVPPPPAANTWRFSCLKTHFFQILPAARIVAMPYMATAFGDSFSITRRPTCTICETTFNGTLTKIRRYAVRDENDHHFKWCRFASLFVAKLTDTYNPLHNGLKPSVARCPELLKYSI